MTRTTVRWDRVLAAAAVILLIGMPLFAGGKAEGTAPAAGPVTLRIAEHPGPHAEVLQEYFIPKYLEETGVRVEMEVLPPDQMWQKMALEAQSGTNYYDMGYHSPGWFGYYHAHVADLTPYIRKYDFDLDAYSEAVQNSHMKNELLRPGEIIAIARNPQTPIYAYRKDWFAHAGERQAYRSRYGRDLAPPTTWSELYDIAEFFTRPAGATVAGETLTQPLFGYSASIITPGGMARAFLAIVYSLGLNGFDTDFRTDLDNPILLEGVAYWKRLIENTFPPQAQLWHFLEHLDFFREGRLATAELWPEGVLKVEDPAGRSAGKVGYAVLPQWPGNRAGLPVGRSFIGGGGVLVFKTPNEEESFKFLQWLFEKNEAEFNLRTAMFARETQFNNPDILNSYAFYDEFLPVFARQMSFGFPRQPIAEWGAVMYNPIGEFASDVVYNVLSPEAAQKRLVDNMNTIFREAGHIE